MALSSFSDMPSELQGLLAFSEHGLMIRWWSLGSAWWEKLSRNLVPVQCTKLIFVPPWEGFSPNSTRSSIMASIMDHDRQADAMVNFQFLVITLNRCHVVFIGMVHIFICFVFHFLSILCHHISLYVYCFIFFVSMKYDGISFLF